jgi:hypothetical protein
MMQDATYSDKELRLEDISASPNNKVISQNDDNDAQFKAGYDP